MKSFTILGVTALGKPDDVPLQCFCLTDIRAGQYGDSFIGSIDYFPPAKCMNDRTGPGVV
jgi:hypothetical protein